MVNEMARAPFQVLVFPYRKSGCGFEFALLKRSDAGYWQAVAGGGESDEKPIEAARRETYEETGLSRDLQFIQLITVLPIPATEFRDRHLWGKDVLLIPQYCFGVLVQNEQIVLSREHANYRWLSFEEACRVMEYDGNKIALWELNERLKACSS